MHNTTMLSLFRGSVEPANLWDAFNDVLDAHNATSLLPSVSSLSDIYVDFTREWTDNPGFPLVNFTRNYTSKYVTVTQVGELER